MNGKQHDRAILITTPIIGAVSFYIQPDYFGFVMASHLFGGYMLSPDLDIVSKPYKRWQLWNLNYWWLYQKAIPHRSLLSHGLFIGTLLRLAYLLLPVLLIFRSDIPTMYQWCLDNREFMIWILLGLEFSAMVHVGCDRISDFQNFRMSDRNKKGSRKSPNKKKLSRV